MIQHPRAHSPYPMPLDLEDVHLQSVALPAIVVHVAATRPPRIWVCLPGFEPCILHIYEQNTVALLRHLRHQHPQFNHYELIGTHVRLLSPAQPRDTPPAPAPAHTSPPTSPDTSAAKRTPTARDNPDKNAAKRIFDTVWPSDNPPTFSPLKTSYAAQQLRGLANLPNPLVRIVRETSRLTLFERV